MGELALRNPSRDQFLGLIARVAKERGTVELRGFFSGDYKEFYMWDSYECTHYDMIGRLGASPTTDHFYVRPSQEMPGMEYIFTRSHRAVQHIRWADRVKMRADDDPELEAFRHKAYQEQERRHLQLEALRKGKDAAMVYQGAGKILWFSWDDRWLREARVVSIDYFLVPPKPKRYADDFNQRAVGLSRFY